MKTPTLPVPFDRCWWIEEDKVLGGCYPGTPDPAESRQRQESLLAAGVIVFLNLQESDEHNREGQAFADYAGEVGRLAKARGVTALCQRFAIHDTGVPTVKLMDQIIVRIAKAIEAGGKVYVHCWGGHGRTGTVAGCWLVVRGHTPDEAFAIIRRNRQHNPYLHEKGDFGSNQMDFVRRWAAERAMPAPDDGWRDRAIGALVGLAVGDAVGTTVEFKPRGSFPPVTDMTGGGPFHLKAGQWTDDTSMALCLAESLVEKRTFDPTDQLARYVRWYRQGHLSSTGRYFDIGNQTRAALQQFEETGEPYCGPTGRENSGNGSLMRLAPMAITLWRTPREAICLAGESSRTTHGSLLCMDACRYFAGLLVGAIEGTEKAKLLSPMYSPAEGSWDKPPLVKEVAAVAGGSFARKTREQIRGSGYVIHCLEAALWAFATTDSFEQAILAAANLGEDADTTAAVCGQIAGAYYGAKAIPSHWREKLAMRQKIEELAAGLCALTGG